MPSVPGTLAYKVRAKYPGAYDDMDDAALEAAVTSKHPGVYDDLPRSTLPTRPVSPEDFTPSKPGFDVGAYFTKTAKLLNPLTIAKGIAQTGMDTRPEDAALGPMAALAPFARQAFAAAGGEAQTALERAKEGRGWEAAGHAGAALLPVVGPSAAHAGEAIGAGDTEEGLAEATALLAPYAAAKVGPLVAPKLASIGEQLAAKAGPLAKKAAPYAVPVALDAAATYFGHSPVYTALKLATKAVKAAKAAPEAEAAAAEAVPSVNAGGRVVPASAPTVEQAVSGALSDLQKPELPRRITTPPEPSLPPSYTPRTTVPKPKMAKAAMPAEHVAEPDAPPKRAYFLRSPEEVAAIQARKAAAAAPETIAPVDITDPAQMPEAWRSRMGPPELQKPRKPATKVTSAQIDELAKGLTDSGLSAREAIRRISKDSSMSAETRVRLMTALGKLAKVGAK